MSARARNVVIASVPLAISAVALVGSISCAYFSREAKPGGLVVSKEIHDFGTLKAGVVVSTDFELTNRFPQRGKIVRLIDSCNCSSVSLSRERLESGEKCLVHIEITAPTVPGDFSQHVIVAFSRPGAPNWDYADLRFTGRIHE